MQSSCPADITSSYEEIKNAQLPKGPNLLASWPLGHFIHISGEPGPIPSHPASQTFPSSRLCLCLCLTKSLESFTGNAVPDSVPGGWRGEWRMEKATCFQAPNLEALQLTPLCFCFTWSQCWKLSSAVTRPLTHGVYLVSHKRWGGVFLVCSAY